MLIDAHHHLWRYDSRDYPWIGPHMSVLQRDFLVGHLERVAKQARLRGTVVVQARQTLEETRWLLEQAAASQLIRGVVGWAPLAEPDVAAELEVLAHDQRLKGFRHVLHDEPDDHYMLRDDFNRGVTQLARLGFAYDILIFERHLAQTIAFVDRHPDQVFIVDHLAKPRIREGVLSPWREGIRELARRERVYCKVSGMVTEAGWQDWTAAGLRPFFDEVLSAFGPRRLMFGSDWPVMNLASSYERWVGTVRSWIADLSPEEQEWICAKTAIEAYSLK